MNFVDVLSVAVRWRDPAKQVNCVVVRQLKYLSDS